MFEIKLKNDKTFVCSANSTIFEAAKNHNIFLDHSCLSARCRSCIVRLNSGNTQNRNEEFVLSDDDKKNNYILSCNAIPTSDLVLDVEDLSDIIIYDKKILPAKINSIDKINDDILKLILRLPPNSDFKFYAGQYVNIIKEGIRRSYSIANSSIQNNELEFFIKKYDKGLMSNFLFNEAKLNDLLRIEGPMGTFFFRDTDYESIIFLATGTGIAPVKSILESIEMSHKKYENKSFWLFFGGRFTEDLFWKPKFKNLNINFIPVLSRENSWDGAKGYVQNIVIEKGIDLEKSQVYACGSNSMIKSSKELFLRNNLKENNFFSDAFVQTN